MISRSLKSPKKFFNLLNEYQINQIKINHYDLFRLKSFEEVKNLVSDGRELSKTASQALGYKQIISYIEGENTLEEAIESAIASTRRFARRQEKWFRRDPRIQWMELQKDPFELLEKIVKKVY